MKRRWTLIETAAQLAKAEKAIRSAGIIALDTEYDSFRYFRDRLCLIQVQADERTWLFDPLAGLDISFLGEALIDPDTLKIFHAGDNDIRILKRDYAFAFRNIFDTHRAASVLGCRKLSLGALLETYLGIVLKKGMQRSRWDLRPLREEQLEYASLDTAHLVDLYRRLEVELREKGLDKAARQICDGMTTVVWQSKSFDHLGYRRLPGNATLTAAQKERLRRLYQWRFEKAKEIDRALFMILPDQSLVGLAKLEAPSLESMVETGLVSSEKVRRFGEELVAVLAPTSESSIRP